MEYILKVNNSIYFNAYLLLIIIGSTFFTVDLMMQKFTESPSIFISINTAIALWLLINKNICNGTHMLCLLLAFILLSYCVIQSGFCLSTIRIAFTLYGLFVLGLYYVSSCCDMKFLYKIFFLATVLLIVYAIMQGLHILPSFHPDFRITGPFDNPAGIAMTLAILLPYSFYLYHVSTGLRKKILIAFVICVTCVLILYSDSRTGIIALVFVIIYLFYKKWNFYRKILVGISLPVLLISIYLLKPLSAQGRIFINTNCLTIIRQNPWWGSGLDGFKRFYMPEQANYFKAHINSHWIQLADNVNFPYNEYIGWVISWGLVGTLILLVLISVGFYYSITHPESEKFYAQASMGALLVCSCFSYPLHYPMIQVLFILFLCILLFRPLNRKKKSFSTFKRKIIPNVTIIITSICLLTISCFQAYYRMEWKKIASEAIDKNSDSILSNYAKLNSNSDLTSNPYFLYNYAAVLYEQRLYQKSLMVLLDCEQQLNNYDVQLLKATNYKSLKMYDKAIQTFTQASYMIPVRLIPLYELLRIYDITGNKKKAYELAIKIGRTPIKIDSFEAEYIKSEASSYLLEHK